MSSALDQFQSAREERKWNRLCENMSAFHQWFKEEYNTLYELADGSFAKRGLSLSAYLETAEQLNSHLTLHHNIEERHVFPFLSQRMPEFSTNVDDGHIKAHEGIHKGLDDLANLVTKFRRNPSSYSPTEMRTCLDGFREVLFTHLDQEVLDLRGENLKKYFSLEEVESLGV